MTCQLRFEPRLTKQRMPELAEVDTNLISSAGLEPYGDGRGIRPSAGHLEMGDGALPIDRLTHSTALLGQTTRGYRDILSLHPVSGELLCQEGRRRRSPGKDQ